MPKKQTKTTKTSTSKPRAKRISKSISHDEPDSTFLLKIVIYVIAGSLWLKFSTPVLGFNGLPVGLIIGLIIASHDHFQIDRKIGYAVLIVAAITSYFLPSGIVI